MSQGNRPPETTFRIGYVKAAVWKNGDFFNVTLTKSYKDGVNDETGKDVWKDTDSLGSGDLLNAVRVLQRAEDWISKQ